MSEELQPWQRLSDEPNKWFLRFDEYRRLGPDRSILAVFNQWRAAKSREVARNSPKSWRDAAEKWQWRQRAEAWDESERLHDEQTWLERREQLREREWAAAQKLIEKAEGMLQFPLASTSREERGGESGGVIAVTTVTPARWGMADAGKLMDTASKLARLSTGLATNIEEHRDKPAEEMSDEELAAIAARGRTPDTPDRDAGASGPGTAETAASA